MILLPREPFGLSGGEGGGGGGMALNNCFFGICELQAWPKRKTFKSPQGDRISLVYVPRHRLLLSRDLVIGDLPAVVHPVMKYGYTEIEK